MEDPREAERLSDKVDAKSWVSKYLLPLNLANKAILDVGCGSAAIIAELAKNVPTTDIVGIDASKPRLEWARKSVRDYKSIELRCGDANALPFEDNSFDFVMCRFLLQYLPDKKKAIQEMYRVLKPNGTILLQDLDGQLVWHYPVDESLQQMIDITISVLSRSGFDPYVGRKLYSLAHQAGFEELGVEVESYHLVPGQADAQIRKQWETKLDIAIPAIASAVGSYESAEKIKLQFLAYLDRNDTLTYSVCFTVSGKK